MADPWSAGEKRTCTQAAFPTGKQAERPCRRSLLCDGDHVTNRLGWGGEALCHRPGATSTCCQRPLVSRSPLEAPRCNVMEPRLHGPPWCHCTDPRAASPHPATEPPIQPPFCRPHLMLSGAWCLIQGHSQACRCASCRPTRFLPSCSCPPRVFAKCSCCGVLCGTPLGTAALCCPLLTPTAHARFLPPPKDAALAVHMPPPEHRPLPSCCFSPHCSGGHPGTQARGGSFE